jgi:hypothetical protein
LFALGRQDEARAALERLFAMLPRGGMSDRLSAAPELRSLAEILEPMGLGDRLRQLRPRPERGR